MRLISQVDSSPRLAKPNPWTLAARGSQRGRAGGHRERGGHWRGSRGNRNTRGRASFGGNHFNADRPSPQADLNPWSRLGAGTTLTGDSAPNGSTSGQELDVRANSGRAQLAEAAELRRRRAEALDQRSYREDRPAEQQTMHVPTDAPNLSNSTTTNTRALNTKRIVIELSDSEG